MKYTKLLIILILVGCGVVISNGQSKLMMPDLSTENGETIVVDVTVAGFQHIVSAQFGVRWDSTVLRFDSVGNFAWQLNANSGFGGTTSSGQLAFLWLTDNFSNGNSVEDSTVLFSITFDVIGENGTFTDLDFGGPSITGPLEIADLEGVISAEPKNGYVAVGVDAVEKVDRLVEDVLCVPNPVVGDMRFSFTLLKDIDINFVIYDSMGRLVYSESEFHKKGNQVISISKDIFPDSGIYYYLLQSGKAMITRKFIFIAD